MLLDAAGLRAHREAETRAAHLLAMLKGQNYRAARTEITALAWVIEPLAVAQDAGEADGPGELATAATVCRARIDADPDPAPPPVTATTHLAPLYTFTTDKPAARKWWHIWKGTP